MVAESADTENELEIVKELSRVSDETRIAVSETGWTSRVYVVDGGKIVFKFPRNEEFREDCGKEIAVLEVLKKHRFDVKVPVLNWTTEDNRYFGFYGVEGKPLKCVIDILSDKEKRDIGTQLGGFLKQLHRVTDCRSISAQTLEEQAADYTDMYHAGRIALEAFLGESELEAIDDFFTHKVAECMTGTGELVFCHGDLDYNNTLVDDAKRVGVIDFGDAGLYDRSQDFRGMEDQTLRLAMMEAYGRGEIISLEASEATAKMIDVLNLLYLTKSKSTKERDECIERIRKSFR